MGQVVAAMVAAVLGVGLAVSASVGLVSAQTATPEPVSQPLVEYGER